MRINWGKAIVLAFVIFIAFILYFVIRVSTDSSYEHEMVTEDYYKKELEFQQEIDLEKNTKEANAEVKVIEQASGLLLRFPEVIDPKEIKGTVSLYRPSNQRLDFELPIALTGTEMLIPKDRLSEGRWDIRVQWQAGGKTYLTKEKITYR